MQVQGKKFLAIGVLLMAVAFFLTFIFWLSFQSTDSYQRLFKVFVSLVIFGVVFWSGLVFYNYSFISREKDNLLNFAFLFVILALLVVICGGIFSWNKFGHDYIGQNGWEIAILLTGVGVISGFLYFIALIFLLRYRFSK